MIINSMPSDVTWFSSSQVGVPQMMGGSNGDLLKVLDACLVTGFGLKPIQSVIVDGNNVTLLFGVGHGFLERQMVQVSGANDPLLNGVHRVVSMTNNTLTLMIVGVVDTAGEIKAKIAPLGWDSMFGSTDALRRAYRSQSNESSKRVLFLDMTYPEGSGYHATSPANRATVSVCGSMDVLGVQIDSFTDSINKFASNPNGSLFWYQKRNRVKTEAIPSTMSQWKIIGNKDFFYLLIGWSANQNYPQHNQDGSNYCDVFGFGEFAKLDSGGDSTFLLAAKYANDNDVVGEISSPAFGAKFTNTASPPVFCMTDTGFAERKLSILSPNGTYTFVSGGGGMSYPNGTASALFTSPIRVGQSSSKIEGVMPSIMFVENNVAVNANASDGTIVDDVLLTHVHREYGYQLTSGYYGFYLGD